MSATVMSLLTVLLAHTTPRRGVQKIARPKTARRKAARRTTIAPSAIGPVIRKLLTSITTTNGSATIQVAVMPTITLTIHGSTAALPAALAAVMSTIWAAEIASASGSAASSSMSPRTTTATLAIGIGTGIPLSFTKIPTTTAGIWPITPGSAHTSTSSISVRDKQTLDDPSLPAASSIQLRASRSTGMDAPKNTGKQAGLAALNLVFVLLILFGAQSLLHGHISNIAGLAILTLLVFGAYLVGYRFIERRRPPELASLISLREFFGGLALGVTLFSAVIAVLWLLRVYHLQAIGTTAGLGASALSALLAATVEETLIRGFLFRIVQMLGGTWIAILISSAFFGASHAFNPGATITSSIAIALEAGVLLAAAYVLTGRLWFPMGLHAGWNVSEGSVYGLSVSGFTAKNALTHGILQGPLILTGGAFGPEASIIAVILCLGTAILLLWRAAKIGRIQPPLWSRHNSPVALSASTATEPSVHPNP